MVLLKKDKEQQLKELTMIVTGIRLFNKASEKGEEDTDLSELSTVHQTAAIKSGYIHITIRCSQTDLLMCREHSSTL